MSSSLMSVAADDGASTAGGATVAEITFVHSDRRKNASSSDPICARWDAVSGGWTADGCAVATANATHTRDANQLRSFCFGLENSSRLHFDSEKRLRSQGINLK